MSWSVLTVWLCRDLTGNTGLGCYPPVPSDFMEVFSDSAMSECIVSMHAIHCSSCRKILYVADCVVGVVSLCCCVCLVLHASCQHMFSWGYSLLSACLSSSCSQSARGFFFGACQCVRLWMHVTSVCGQSLWCVTQCHVTQMWTSATHVWGQSLW